MLAKSQDLPALAMKEPNTRNPAGVRQGTKTRQPDRPCHSFP